MSKETIEKIPFDDFIKSCAHFLIMPELEARMNCRIEGILKQLLDFTSNGAQGNLQVFLQKEKDFLGLMLNVTGIPQEKFLRILSAERFSQKDYGNEWGIDKVHTKIKKDDQFAEKVANLLLEGRNNNLLAEKVASFYLEQLSLSEDWESLMHDKNYITRIARKKLAGEYNNEKGIEFEEKIKKILTDANIQHDKGQVELVQKEVDHAIPSLDNPKIMIMACYYETTSSGQTTRANEQTEMYSKICKRNARYPNKQPLIFINIVDGGGWLARRSDLKKLYSSCDYCLNDSMLMQLPTIIKQHTKTTS
ncbi:MAG: hypothetical protein K0U19_01800 [Proteobacteria bacterium]|nr:hypothetical protein [Pseudomonadota bacterium]